MAKNVVRDIGRMTYSITIRPKALAEQKSRKLTFSR